MKAAVLALAAVAACGAAGAQSVALQGMLGSKALLIVDGAPPKSVAPGESHQGVKVISTAGDSAVLEFGGKRHTLQVGDAPASVGGGAVGSRGTRIVLPVSSGGHFVTQGAINGRPVTFMVDTGATVIALSAGEADRMGLSYRNAPGVMMNTANGVAQAWRVKLGSVRVGEVEVHGVDAVVTPMPMSHVLLGNSFLGRFQMTRTNDQMVLERRY